MKKIIPILIAVAILLSSCSKQEGVTPEIFIERATASMKCAKFDTDNAFRDENGYHCFGNLSEEEILLTCRIDENNIVYEACVTSVKQGLSDELRCVCVELIRAFSDDELAENTVETLVQKADEMPSYVETQWFTYCMMNSENGFYFSVYDKKLKQENIPELTLKENDLAGYK